MPATLPSMVVSEMFSLGRIVVAFYPMCCKILRLKRMANISAIIASCLILWCVGAGCQKPAAQTHGTKPSPPSADAPQSPEHAGKAKQKFPRMREMD
jgi:hypothetical protein